MSETNAIPDDFDLEAFQREVESELLNTFSCILPYGDNDPPAKAKPPSTLTLLLSSANAYALLVLGLSGGFLLGGGSLLIPSLTRNLLLILLCSLIPLFTLASYISWKERRDAKRRLEKKIIRTKEAEAKRRIALLQAEEILAKDDIRSKICPALHGLFSDIFDLSKSVSSVLITLAIAGQLSITLTPLVVAAVVVMLVKTGVKAYCGEASGK